MGRLPWLVVHGQAVWIAGLVASVAAGLVFALVRSRLRARRDVRRAPPHLDARRAGRLGYLAYPMVGLACFGLVFGLGGKWAIAAARGALPELVRDEGDPSQRLFS
ncbi:MAG: hypothetical protein IT379_00230, partial [Deltaproteobacteria bacterium]|nr:hypothetical protein [Deltaproteobacteria bacterium]